MKTLIAISTTIGTIVGLLAIANAMVWLSVLLGMGISRLLW